MKSHAAALTAAVVAVIGVIGVWLFVESLRPCRLKLRPGQLVTYRLTTEWSPIAPDDTRGQPSVSEQEVDLICIGDDNEVALVNPGGPGRRDEITLLKFAAQDGSARRFETTSQVHDEGKALGFFDFNLLPLPPGSEQAWNVSLVYAALPPDKRQVQGKVRRVTNGSHPSFKLTLPPIEWLNDERRWQQIKDLACNYRFDTAKGLIESATVECQAAVERPDLAERYPRYHVRTDLTLVGVTKGKDEPLALRDLAFATADAQDACATRRLDRIAPALGRLASSHASNETLRALADRLRIELGRDDGQQHSAHAAPRDRAPHAQAGETSALVPLEPPAAEHRGWSIQVGSAPVARRGNADRLAKDLAAAGFPVHVVERAHHALVLVGPYPQQDAAVLGSLKKNVAKTAKPFWVRVE